MEKLANSNLEELKNNNIIILEIDEANNSNKNVFLKLVIIEKIDYYAKCLGDEAQNKSALQNIQILLFLLLFHY